MCAIVLNFFYPTRHFVLIMLDLHRLEDLTCGTELIKCPSCPYFFFLLRLVPAPMARAPAAPPPPTPSESSMAHGGVGTRAAELARAWSSPAAAYARQRSSIAAAFARRPKRDGARHGSLRAAALAHAGVVGDGGEVRKKRVRS
jgi:hypothetical protein